MTPLWSLLNHPGALAAFATVCAIACPISGIAWIWTDRPWLAVTAWLCGILAVLCMFASVWIKIAAGLGV